MSIVTTFFSSPFSDQSTTLQVRRRHLGPESATGLGRRHRALGTGHRAWHVGHVLIHGPLCLGTEHVGVSASPSGSLCPVIGGHPGAALHGCEGWIRKDLLRKAARARLPGPSAKNGGLGVGEPRRPSRLRRHVLVLSASMAFVSPCGIKVPGRSGECNLGPREVCST